MQLTPYRGRGRRGLLPRQLQSITWEAARGFFPDTFKNAKNVEAVDNIWNNQAWKDQPG
jgi:hypothetical protein